MSFRRRVGCAAVATVLLAAAAPLGAQGFFVAAEGGYFDMSGAKRSLEAVVGSSGFATFGIETGYGLKRGLYGSAGVSFSPMKEGERVFLAPGLPPFKLGFPLTLKRGVIYVNAGWRFLQQKRFVPYAAIGVEFDSFDEESDVAGESFSQSQTKTGFRALAGLEVKVWRQVRFGVEVVGSTVPDAIGVGGVSAVYGEDNIGGVTVQGKLIYNFARPKAPANTVTPDKGSKGTPPRPAKP